MTCWINGDKGEVFVTHDGGVNWTSGPTKVDRELHDIYFVNHTTGWAVGDNGTILRASPVR